MQSPRVFLGGVPFGCDNIGDEAILASIVRIVREDIPHARITVSTAQPEETQRLLKVNAVPLYGFRPQWPLRELKRILQNHDVFIWSGATGLSDYPALAVSILRMAQGCGLKTIVWGVGMDSTLNPAFFKLGGKKLALCKLLSKFTLGRIDCVSAAEHWLAGRMKHRIAQTLRRCSLVVVRDYQTQAILRAQDAELPVFTGADSAILCNEPKPSLLDALPGAVREALLAPGEKIGLCMSAQRPIQAEDALSHTLDALLAPAKRRLFLIPMNPVTDAALMATFREKLAHKDKVFLISRCEAPEAVVTVASHCGVVVSSRLHLLILAANVGVPICGISRGSKVDNFLIQFGLKTAGSVSDAEFSTLQHQVENHLAHPEVFREAHEPIYAGLFERLSQARARLRRVIL